VSVAVFCLLKLPHAYKIHQGKAFFSTATCLERAYKQGGGTTLQAMKPKTDKAPKLISSSESGEAFDCFFRQGGNDLGLLNCFAKRNYFVRSFGA
jgi:hypothetical protein